MKSQSLRFARMLLHISGYVQKENPSNRTLAFKVKAVFFQICVALTCFSAFEYFFERSLRNAMAACLLAVATFHVFLKQIIISRSDNFIKMLEMGDALSEILLVDSESEDIFQQADSECYKFSKILLAGCLTYIPQNITGMFIQYFMFGNLVLPLELWTPTPDSFMLSLAFQVTIMGGSSLVIGCYIVPLSIICRFTAIYIKVLRYQLAKRPAVWSKEYDRQLVNNHKNVIEFVNVVNKSWGGILAFELILSSIQSCFAGYQVIKAFQANDVKAPLFICVLLLTCLPPFVICTSGQDILNESEKLHRAGFEGLWYKNEPSSRMILCMLMLITSKYLPFHYKGVIKFNMERLAVVFQGTYSYMAMINSAENRREAVA